MTIRAILPSSRDAARARAVSLALQLIFAAKAKSTHHMLALDALRHLRIPQAEAWRDCFLYYHATYLEGAKAPDSEFRDFRNHVLHVSDRYWGGAVAAATKWYGHLLSELRAGDFAEAAYCAGVLSHYYTDPLMPFHTGQSESEGAVHRAAEWSVTKSYEQLRELLLDRLGGWPEATLPDGPDWIRDAIYQAAQLSHPHYDFLIDHYNLERGVKKPTEGFDEPSRVLLAQLLGFGAVGFARLLERAIVESAVAPPVVSLAPHIVFAMLGAPIAAVAKKFADQKERAAILAMYDEYVATGKCIITLPEDERVVRAAYAKEVLGVPVSELDAEPARKPGQEFGVGAAPRIVSIPSESAVSTTAVAPAPVKETAAASKPAASVQRVVDEPKPASAPTPAVETTAASIDTVDSSAPSKLAAAKQTFVAGATKLTAAVGALSGNVKSIASRLKPKLKSNASTQNAASETVDFQPAAKSNKNAKFYLELTSNVEDGPSIGPKMAARLASVGVQTVADLLQADPAQLGAKLGFNAAAATKLKDWQDQARLVCRIPNLRGHDAQILVACGVRDPQSLARANPAELTRKAIAFAKTPEGVRLLRGSLAPDAEEVADWIAWAKSARQLKAA